MAVYLSGAKDRYSVEKLFNDGSAIDQTQKNYLNRWYRIDKDSKLLIVALP